MDSASQIQTIIEQLKDHEARIKSLEDGYSNENGLVQEDIVKAKTSVSKSQEVDYSGPSGGVRLLYSKGFFKSKRDLSSIREELKRNDYNYPRQSVNTALVRLSSIKGPLVVLKEGGRRVYVERK